MIFLKGRHKLTGLRCCFLTIMLVLVFSIVKTASIVSYALDTKISFSDPSAVLGNEINVTMKVSAVDEGGKLGKADIMLSYDPDSIEFISGDNAQGGAGSVKVSAASASGNDSEWVFNLKFKTLKAGESDIKISTWEIQDLDAKPASLSHEGSAKVTIAAAAESSANADLASLGIYPGILSPAFSPEITQYSAQVGGEVNNVAISAPAADANAVISVSGGDNLVLGENKIECKVTAQDGSTVKVYTITVTKTEGFSTPVADGQGNVGAELSSEKAVVGGQTYSVASSFDASLLPEGYTVGRYVYNGRDVAAGRTEVSDIIVMYLIADDGSGGLFAYDEKSGNWSQFAVLTSSAKKITVVPLPQGVQVPQGFKEVSFETGGNDAKTKISGWVWASSAEPEYYIVYAMNTDGEKSFYRFDVKEKNFQRYFSDPAIENAVPQSEYDSMAGKYNELLKDYNIRGIALIALIILLVIIIVVLFIKRRKSVSDNDYTQNAGSGTGGMAAAGNVQTKGNINSDKADTAGAGTSNPDKAGTAGAKVQNNTMQTQSSARVKVIKREDIESKAQDMKETKAPLDIQNQKDNCNKENISDKSSKDILKTAVESRVNSVKASELSKKAETEVIEVTDFEEIEAENADSGSKPEAKSNTGDNKAAESNEKNKAAGNDSENKESGSGTESGAENKAADSNSDNKEAGSTSDNKNKDDIEVVNSLPNHRTQPDKPGQTVIDTDFNEVSSKEMTDEELINEKPKL